MCAMQLDGSEGSLLSRIEFLQKELQSNTCIQSSLIQSCSNKKNISSLDSFEHGIEINSQLRIVMVALRIPLHLSLKAIPDVAVYVVTVTHPNMLTRWLKLNVLSDIVVAVTHVAWTSKSCNCQFFQLYTVCAISQQLSCQFVCMCKCNCVRLPTNKRLSYTEVQVSSASCMRGQTHIPNTEGSPTQYNYNRDFSQVPRSPGTFHLLFCST